MKFTDRLTDLAFLILPWLAAIGVIAGIVHLSSILAMPRLAPHDAYARIATFAPANKIVLIPPASEAGDSPFDDPALVQGVCRYDLAEGPVRLRATLPPDRLMMFSFNARFGQLFYSMTDRSATRGKLDVLLVTRQQLDVIEANDNEDELPQDLRIIAPTLQGFLLFRALAEYPGDVADARSRIQSMSCGLDRDSHN